MRSIIKLLVSQLFFVLLSTNILAQVTFEYTGKTVGYNVYAREIAVGDLDNDGDFDIIMGVNMGPSYVYFNDGDANFEFKQALPNNIPGNEQLLGDIDSDNDLDLVQVNSDGLKIFINDGNGSFTYSGQNLSGDRYIFHATFIDCDGDNDLDLATASYSESNGGTIWKNDGAGSFTNYGSSFAVIHKIVTIDLEDDGDIDMIAGNQLLFNDGNMNYGFSVRCLKD